MKKMNSAARLTVFSMITITVAVFILYLMLTMEIRSDAVRQGVEFTYSLSNLLSVAALLIATIIFAYFASSLIIDKILNPIRLITAKVKKISEMDFSKPLAIETEDDELREYVVAFNNMSEKLNSYIERQKRFISDASHELATPITAINGHADLLLRRGKENLELLDNGLAVIKTEALRMNELVDSLLLLARSDSNKQSYTFLRTDITELLNESIAEAMIIAPDFVFEMDIGCGIAVKCDEYAIRRVMRIILSNAVKYSGTGNKKLIQIKCHESHGLVTVFVKDNGIGIPSEHLPRIFDRFYRVDDSRSKKTGSSGLGLAIAKEIIDAHGGSIQACSKPGEGTEFSFALSA